MNATVNRHYPAWQAPWTVEDVMSIPEYPNVGVLPDYADTPDPEFAVVRMAEQVMMVYEVYYREPGRLYWFIPMVRRYIREEYIYSQQLQEHTEHVLETFEDAVHMAAGMLMRQAL